MYYSITQLNLYLYELNHISTHCSRSHEPHPSTQERDRLAREAAEARAQAAAAAARAEGLHRLLAERTARLGGLEARAAEREAALKAHLPRHALDTH